LIRSVGQISSITMYLVGPPRSKPP